MGKKRIIIVEENKLVRKALERTMKDHFWIETVTATNGEEVIELLTGEDPPVIDLIISDNKMGGVNGPVMLERLRQHGIYVPCLMLSGGWDIEDRDKAISLGAICLDKPLSVGVLVFVVGLLTGLKMKSETRARARALTFRAQGTSYMVLALPGAAAFDPITHFLEWRDVSIALEGDSSPSSLFRTDPDGMAAMTAAIHQVLGSKS
ncbi:response regulator [Patescibacteria group bacterium]|nr:response regulator [Patescibacteria group bacterium]